LKHFSLWVLLIFPRMSHRIIISGMCVFLYHISYMEVISLYRIWRHIWSLFLFVMNFVFFGFLDQFLRRRALVQSGRSCFYLFLFIISSIVAWWSWNRHESVCNLTSTYINLSAVSQVLVLASKSLFDLDYLSTYGTLKVKIIWYFFNTCSIIELLFKTLLFQIMEISVTQLLRICALLPLSALVLCLSLALWLDWDGSVDTLCYLNGSPHHPVNLFPSISMLISDSQPMLFIWRSFIALHIFPRYMLG